MIGSNKGHATIDWNKDHLDHVLTGNLQIRAAPLSASGDLLTPSYTPAGAEGSTWCGPRLVSLLTEPALFVMMMMRLSEIGLPSACHPESTEISCARAAVDQRDSLPGSVPIGLSPCRASSLWW